MFAKLFLIACFAILPNCVLAQETWSKGDHVATFFICNKEKDIMDIVLSDTKDKEEYSKIIIEKSITNNCFKIMPPQMFIVDEVISTYKDYKNTDTCVLKIKAKYDSKFVGYIVAAGIPKKDKGI